jgi:hypothetical protein
MAEDNGDITLEDEDAEEAPLSLRSRVIQTIVGVAVVLVLVLGFLHVSLRPVASDRPAPKNHYPGPCWACHMISENAGAADGE